VSNPPTPRRLLSRGSWPEAERIADVLRKETVGGALLLVAAAVALVWANSSWADAYQSLRDTAVGPESLHLRLSLGTWAGDGLLAIFFFVAGLELKREFVAGDLRDPGRAAVPVAAALGGVLAPALVYALLNLGGSGDLRGWAIPTATDIAFALAVLAIIGSHLPSALRTFLLTLAVVDDLLAITIIAIFYTKDLSALPLLLAVAVVVTMAVEQPDPAGLRDLPVRLVHEAAHVAFVVLVGAEHVEVLEPRDLPKPPVVRGMHVEQVLRVAVHVERAKGVQVLQLG